MVASNDATAIFPIEQRGIRAYTGSGEILFDFIILLPFASNGGIVYDVEEMPKDQREALIFIRAPSNFSYCTPVNRVPVVLTQRVAVRSPAALKSLTDPELVRVSSKLCSTSVTTTILPFDVPSALY